MHFAIHSDQYRRTCPAAPSSIVVGIVGATVMPHVLWLHSSLTSDQAVSVGSQEGRPCLRRGNFLGLHLRETVVILAVAGCVNVAILVLGAAAFYRYGYTNIQQISQAYDILGAAVRLRRGR
jgi:manganese transport protein